MEGRHCLQGVAAIACMDGLLPAQRSRRRSSPSVVDSCVGHVYFCGFPEPASCGLERDSRGDPGQTAGPFRFLETLLEDCVVEIQLGENDRLDWALKQFRRRMIRSGLFKDMRRKRFYEKPSEAKKAKSKAAQRRRAKDRRNARRRD